MKFNLAFKELKQAIYQITTVIYGVQWNIYLGTYCGEGENTADKAPKPEKQVS
jgi:hypothetical protein